MDKDSQGIIPKVLSDLALQTTSSIEAEKYLMQRHEISSEIFDPQSENIVLYSLGFLLRQTGKTNETWNF